MSLAMHFPTEKTTNLVTLFVEEGKEGKQEEKARFVLEPHCHIASGLLRQ